ncbi:hypothetical protein ABPG77_011266 [Micractinium sp. CCAP 211/92]
MPRFRGLVAALGALLAVSSLSNASGRALLEQARGSGARAEERLLLETADLVLSVDAAEADAGSQLSSLVGTRGDATWTSTENPAVSVKLTSAGYDTGFGGSVVFTAPGSYGLSSELLDVTSGAWGDEFTAVAWVKAAGTPDPSAVLLQVLYADDSGSWGSSATWRLGSFADKAQGYVALDGFAANAPYSAGTDCWQQLAVVKNGPTLTWYYNKDAAGNASAPFVVNDYGTAGIAIGVDYAAAGGSNSSAIDPSQTDLGWLSGNVGMLAVYSRALDAAAIASIYDEQQAANRYSEALCTRVPTTGLSPPVDVSSPPSSAPSPSAGQSPGPAPSQSPPESPPLGGQSPGLSPSPPSPTPTPSTSPSPPSPTPSPTTSPNPPSPTPGQSPPTPPSTLDVSTASVTGSGASGSVSNQLAFTGGEELADFQTNTAKQQELKQAILQSLNVDPSYTTNDITINVIKVEQRTVTQVTRVQITEWVVICEYILNPTPACPVEVLEKVEINVYLFIRVQAPVIPWWKGPTATVCQCQQDGQCHPQTPPVPPPPRIPDCSSNICFLLDGSKSLFNVDAWNDVVAAARSIMYSINSPDSIFDVFWFSNEVERIGTTVTGAEVASNNEFIRTLVNTLPNAHGTFMAQAIGTCQGVLNDAEAGNSKTIVLITDGKPTDREQALAAADAVKAEGIKMVVVGAGEIDYDTLKELSSGPSFTFANYNLDSAQLLLLADLASEGVCRELD